jgi:hypothetical protein
VIAVAWLAPIGRLLDRADVIDLYDEYCFGHQLDRLEDIPLLLDHDPARRVGDVLCSARAAARAGGGSSVVCQY